MQSITLQTNDTIVVSGDILGRVQFAASAESDGGAARLAGPGILGMAEGSYGSSSNPASLVFATSAADGNAATNRIKISHEGDIVPIGGSYDIGQSDGYGFNHIYVSGATVAGVREVKLYSGTDGSFISKKGDSGTWAFSIDAHGSSDTVHRGFGFHGSADSLTSIWIGGAYNTPYQKFTTTETVLNENGDDRDLRVEGDTDTDLLLVDAGNDIVQIGKLNINGAFTLPTADGSANQVLQTNGGGTVTWADSGGGGGGSMTTVKANGSQVGGADIVTLDFASDFTIGETPDTEINISIADGAITSAKIGALTDVLRWEYPDKGLDGNVASLGYLRAYDESGGYAGFGVSTSSFNIGTSGAINMRFITAGSERAIINTDGDFIFNEDGAAVDFRVEGDTDANLLFVDGSADKVGIGTSSPSKKLHVAGDLLIDDGSAIVFDTNGLKITDDTVGATLDTNLDDAIVIGEGSRSYADKSINIANGRFSSDGDSQKILQVLRGSTTNSSLFYLSNTGSTAVAFMNGSDTAVVGPSLNSDSILLPSNAVFTFTIHVSCRKQSSDDSAAWVIRGAVRNSKGWADDTVGMIIGASNISSTMNYHLIDSPIVESYIDSALAGVTAEVTTSYYNPHSTNTISNAWFGIQVNGLSSTNLRWSAMVDGILTTY